MIRRVVNSIFSYILGYSGEKIIKVCCQQLCAVNSCSNNRRKLNEWKQTFCELHQQKHEDCSCMIPYRLHAMPSKESMRLQWANALNRKSPLSRYLLARNIFWTESRQKETQFHNLSRGMKKRQLLAGENL